MFNSSKAKRRVVAWWSLFAIVLNLFQPAFVALTLAPIIIPSDVMAEELVESSPAPSPAATIEPTTTPEPTLPTDSRSHVRLQSACESRAYSRFFSFASRLRTHA